MPSSVPDSVEILQRLIRYDTSNPPGREAEAIAYLKGLFDRAGIATTLLARDAQRPNLIARLPGRGEAPPLLLEGHVDVVPVSGQQWSHPPFGAEIDEEGVLWGRGALDDKAAVAMMVAALLKAKGEGLQPPGDLLFAALADEEQSGACGARFLVEEHPEQFEGVRFGIGEGGGFAVHMGGAKFYPIMVAEKQHATLRVTLRGRAGHGSVPLRGGAMTKLAEVLRTLDRQRLPVHLLPVTERMIRTLSDALSFPQGAVLRRLLNPALTDRVLDLLGDNGTQLNPLLHNTVSPTRLKGSDAVNVIPGAVTLDLDGRLLPGFAPDDLVAELRALIGEGPEIELLAFEPGPPQAKMERYDLLAAIMREVDPAGTPVPHLLSGVTDARYFARLGISLYGFVPLDLPPGLLDTVHAADERVPVAAVRQGTEVLYTVLQRMRG
jgi:acetylornithine deacetylase/succinyl-diaminopimelate desuccinylase-like protein